MPAASPSGTVTYHFSSAGTLNWPAESVVAASIGSFCREPTIRRTLTPANGFPEVASTNLPEAPRAIQSCAMTQPEKATAAKIAITRMGLTRTRGAAAEEGARRSERKCGNHLKSGAYGGPPFAPSHG